MSLVGAEASNVFDHAEPAGSACASRWSRLLVRLGQSGRPGGSQARLAWACAIVAIVVYALVIVVFPAGSLALLVADNVGSALAAALAAALSFLAARRQPTRRARLSWVLLGFGLACWAFGDSFWAWSEVVLGEMPDVPSWADVGYVAMVMLVVAGAALHPISHPREVSRARLLLDTSVFLSAVVAVVWAVILDPLFTRLETDPLTQAITLLYPLASLTALFLLTMLMLRSAETTPSTRLLAVGWALIAIADSAYVVLVAGDTYMTGHPADLLWFAGAVLIALAATLDMALPGTSEPSHDIGRPWQFAVPTLLLVLAAAVVWLHGIGTDEAITSLDLPTPDQAALAIAGILLVIRMALGYRDAVLVHELFVQHALEREATRQAREEAARLQGVVLTGREIGHLVNNDLAVTLGWVDLLREHPDLPDELREIVSDAAVGLDRAAEHLHQLQKVTRVATHETPVGLALDLEQSAGRPDYDTTARASS